VCERLSFEKNGEKTYNQMFCRLKLILVLLSCFHFIPEILCLPAGNNVSGRNLMIPVHDSVNRSDKSHDTLKRIVRFDHPDAPLDEVIECTSAQVSCSGNTYTFPANTSGNAPPVIDGYPNYGCLSTQPCPVWYYMQVSAPGDIIIDIAQAGGLDVDFICWGPFTSLSSGCEHGLTGDCPKPGNPCCSNTDPGCVHPKGNIVDCSYSPLGTETCHIMNAQTGEIYILLMTNFSQQPTTLTFSQTGGNGVTNCDIVVFCSMIAITANPAACDILTNTFSVSGNIEFSNPSLTGTLTITDNTAIPPVQQSFSPPFTSPLAYNLTNIPCDGAIHSLTAAFSDSLNCNLTQQYTAPDATCPQSLVFTTGSPTICADTIGVVVSVNPDPATHEYHFSYNPPQPGVTITQLNLSDPFITISFSPTATSGFIEVYGTNSFCMTPGPVSQLPVTVNPLPVLTFPALDATCINVPAFILNMSTPAGGTYSGTGIAAGMFDPGVAGTGLHTITYTYTDGNGCTNVISQTIMVNELPAITFNGLPDVCLNQPPLSLTAASPPGGTYSGPGVTAGTFDPSAAGQGTHTITYVYTNGNGCTNSANQTITVHGLPVITFQSLAEVCVDHLPFALTSASPPGGTYSGTGVVAGSFYPSVAGVGNHTITYTFTDLNSCTNSGSQTIQVYPLPVVDFTGPFLPETVCQDDPVPAHYQVSADPLTIFTWSIPSPYTSQGVVTPVPGFPNIADVTWTGTATAQLKLDGISSNGCQDSKTRDIYINPKPIVSMPSCFDPVTIPTARPIILHGGTPIGLTGTYAGEGVSLAGGQYLFDPSSVTGPFPKTVSITYTYTNTFSCPSSDITSILIVNPTPFQCGNAFLPLADVRTAPAYKTYNTFQTGNRCWMAHNLDYGTESEPLQPQTDNCEPQKYCPPAVQGGCTSGGFYQWDELMQYGSVEGSQGLCPPGWHVPTSPEWQDLINFVANANPGDGKAGSDLLYPTGFNALPQGIYYQNDTWSFLSGSPTATMFWTSTLSNGKSIARGLNTVSPSVSLYESSGANAFPVRCIKD